ncbi:MAG: OmpH family outer membrane protein [Proteobacteria bacterium]|nr:OmpH family outer membrane protein [Pseudomonadota bacterium]
MSTEPRDLCHRRWVRFALVLALLASPALSARAAEEPRVAVVDVQKAFQHSPLLMAVTGTLTSQFRPLQGKIRGKAKRVAALRRQLADPNTPLSSEERLALQTRADEESTALAALQADYQRDLRVVHDARSQQARAEIESIARTLAREHGLPLVLREASEPPTDENPEGPSLDLTDAVIRKLIERMNPTRDAAPLAGTAEATQSGHGVGAP